MFDKKVFVELINWKLEQLRQLEESERKELERDIDIEEKQKVFELMFKQNTPKKVIINEYLIASEFFLEKIQIGYLNAILDKISKELRKDD